MRAGALVERVERDAADGRRLLARDEIDGLAHRPTSPAAHAASTTTPSRAKAKPAKKKRTLTMFRSPRVQQTIFRGICAHVFPRCAPAEQWSVPTCAGGLV